MEVRVPKRLLLILAAFLAVSAGHVAAQEKSIVVASTTSTQDSGLFDYLLPIVKQKLGIDVKGKIVLARHGGSWRGSFRRGMFRRRLMNGLPDALIGAAAANMAAESFINVRVGGRGIFCKQRGGAHNHADLAVAALRNLVREPCLLHGMLSVGRKSFDGGDAAPGHSRDARGAGSRGFAIHVYSAGTAEGLAAAEFCAGES